MIFPKHIEFSVAQQFPRGNESINFYWLFSNRGTPPKFRVSIFRKQASFSDCNSICYYYFGVCNVLRSLHIYKNMIKLEMMFSRLVLKLVFGCATHSISARPNRTSVAHHSLHHKRKNVDIWLIEMCVGTCDKCDTCNFIPSALKTDLNNDVVAFHC